MCILRRFSTLGTLSTSGYIIVYSVPEVHPDTLALGAAGSRAGLGGGARAQLMVARTRVGLGGVGGGVRVDAMVERMVCGGHEACA